MTEPDVASVTFRNAIGHDPSAQELARLMSTRMRYLPQTVAESKAFRVLPGVRATLDRLDAAGALERASVLLGEPVDPGQVLVVGDTPHDVEAAHGAGAVAVGVATGHFDAEALRDAGADHVLVSLEEEFPLSARGVAT
jgi:phosphoglycolate phosphatase